MNDMISNVMKIKMWEFFPEKNIFNQNNNKIKIKCTKSFYDKKKNSEHFNISIIKIHTRKFFY